MNSAPDTRTGPGGDADTTLRSRRVLIGVTIVWVGLFGFLLLTSNPPRVPYANRDWGFTAGHFFGSLLLAVQLVAVLTPHRSDRRTRYRAAMWGLLVSLAFVFGMEIAQEFRPVRGYELSDGIFNIAGVGAGVTLASLIQQRPAGPRLLQRSTTAFTAVLTVLVVVLVVL